VTNLSFTDGAANSISETLQPSPQSSLNLSIPGSQWAPLFQNIGPSTTQVFSSWLSVAAEPYVSGRNAPANFLGPNLYLVSTPPVSGGISPEGACLPEFPLLPVNQPPALTDQNFGALAYGDPFPSVWTRTEAFCQEAAVMIPYGTSLTSYGFFIVDGETSVPSGSPVAPAVSQVQSPAINGDSLYTAATINTTSPALNWSAPATGAPYGYTVTPWQITLFSNGIQFASAGTFGTAKTSITLPPLAPGNYIFVITALSDGAANMETSPLRSALPTGFATVVSAPMTISSSAAQARIYGDTRVVKLLSKPGQFRRALPMAGPNH
jgi:hypothetical protein